MASQQEQLTLHEAHLSGNSYKVRLTASLLGIRIHKLIDYNVLKQETRTPEYLARVNANGRLPVLQVGNDTFLPESNAACYYLADDPDSKANLIPRDRLEHARMLQWMFFEQYSHEPCIAVLRFWRTMVGVDNLTETQKAQIPGKEKQAAEVLDVMEHHLTGREWFVANHVSLADVVLFAYTHCLDESGLDISKWPAIERWVGRVEGLERYVKLAD